MQKTYVLDTNVLMYEPKSLFAFEDNEVVIPLIVLDELDKHKNGTSQTAKHARMTIRSLDALRAKGNLHEGVLTDRGGKIRVELNNINQVPQDLDPNRADNRIVSVALGLKKKYKDSRKIAVVTKDINLRVKCDALGVNAEDFISGTVIQNLDELYSGCTNITVEKEDIDKFYSQGFLEVKNILRPLNPHEYVLLTSDSSDKHTALAKFNGTMLSKIRVTERTWGVSPRNKEQKFAFDALFDPDIKLVTITGKAGTGKTLCAATAAVAQTLDSNAYSNIVLTRPIQPVGRDLGYLPGDKYEKMAPWMAPLNDNLNLIFSDQGKYFLDSFIEKGIIEIEPLAYIRGRSMPKSYIIVDEAQNLTKHEVKTLITRVGEGSKVVLTGDIEQIDTPYIDSVDNGLSHVVEVFKGDSIAAHITMYKGERSELATKAAEML